MIIVLIFSKCSGDHRDLHVLTDSFPTRLSSELVPLIAIAKGPHHGREGREVFHFFDGREKTLPINSPVLFHLQNLRDEVHRSEAHTSELQSLMRISYDVFCL